MTDRVGDILRNYIVMIERQLHLIGQGIDIESDDPAQISRREELLRDLAAVSENLERHTIMSRK
jgi:glycine/D-amino acid oxidase-like deaminating enzyme